MTTVLIVDDEPNIREVLYERLAEAGYKIITASDGISAKELINSEVFDLVITDIIMPDMDGLELIQYIKNNRPNIKIIAISAGGRLSNTDTYLKPAKHMGADKMISKPFDLDEMVMEVENLLKAE